MARSLGLPSSIRVERATEAFAPDTPIRQQLSALVEDMVVARLTDGRLCTIGWIPERSPGGAFRIEVDGAEPSWAESWVEVTRQVARASGDEH